MKFSDVRKYVKGILTNSFTNKTTLDKLSTSSNGDLLFNGNEIKGGGEGGTTNNYLGIDVYSEEEKVIGKWIDGRPLYRRIESIYITNASNSGWNLCERAITSEMNVIRIINDIIIQGTAYPTNFYFTVNGNSCTSGVIELNGKKQVALYTNYSPFADKIAKVGIEYTKTTDAENSFTPSMILNSIGITGSNENSNIVVNNGMYNANSICGSIYSSSYRPVNFGGTPTKPELTGGFFDGIHIISSNQGSIFSTNKIDFSKYNKLIFEYKHENGYSGDLNGRSLWIFALDEIKDNYPREIDIALWATSRGTWTNLGGTVHELDISSINDERYLAISCNFMDGYINNLRFE